MAARADEDRNEEVASLTGLLVFPFLLIIWLYMFSEMLTTAPGGSLYCKSTLCHEHQAPFSVWLFSL